MRERDHGAAAHDRLPSVRVMDAHEPLDVLEGVVRRAQQLQVVTRVLHEGALDHAAQRCTFRWAAGRRADAAQVLRDQRAAPGSGSIPGAAGEVCDGVGHGSGCPPEHEIGETQPNLQETPHQHQRGVAPQFWPRRAASSAPRAQRRSASVCGQMGRNMYHCEGSSRITSPSASASACVAR